VSARELADEAIARIEATNPELNFLVSDCFDDARNASPPDGPFAGVPMLVKDLTETAGLRTTFSSRAFADYVPQVDAAVVRRMKNAGFVVLGKSNTPEFGITAVTESDLNGACRNPWDTSRTPGGSSGGAAAAVAAGVLPLAHGSDGGGSVRIPAACCGLFGLKPSRGRVSPAPFVSGSLELSQPGPLSVSVRDAAAFLDVIAGYEPGDAH
jgi:amidase